MQKVTLLLVLFFAGIANVSAAPVLYTLNNVVFDDGSTATGTFTHDSEVSRENFISVNITTTNGVFLGDSYILGYNSGNDTAGQSADYGFAAPNGGNGNVFIFNLDKALGDFTNGDTFVLEAGSNEYARNQTKTSRYIVSGSIVSAVPVPTAVWLFGSGLSLLGWMRRKA